MSTLPYALGTMVTNHCSLVGVNTMLVQSRPIVGAFPNTLSKPVAFGAARSGDALFAEMLKLLQNPSLSAEDIYLLGLQWITTPDRANQVFQELEGLLNRPPVAGQPTLWQVITDPFCTAQLRNIQVEKPAWLDPTMAYQLLTENPKSLPGETQPNAPDNLSAGQIKWLTTAYVDELRHCAERMINQGAMSPQEAAVSAQIVEANTQTLHEQLQQVTTQDDADKLFGIWTSPYHNLEGIARSQPSGLGDAVLRGFQAFNLVLYLHSIQPTQRKSLLGRRSHHQGNGTLTPQLSPQQFDWLKNSFIRYTRHQFGVMNQQVLPSTTWWGSQL